jgi:NADH:ubiquinone oxidoreductase subunit 2 (subunit N)
MYFKESDAAADQEWDISPAFRYMLVITAAVIIVLGVYPNLLLDWLYY